MTQKKNEQVSHLTASVLNETQQSNFPSLPTVSPTVDFECKLFRISQKPMIHR